MTATTFLKIFILALIISVPNHAFCQEDTAIVAGPVVGQVGQKIAKVWLQVRPSVKSVALKYWKVSNPSRTKTITYKGSLGGKFNMVKFSLPALSTNSTYNYQFIVDGQPLENAAGKFKTQKLIKSGTTGPDFSFITGSCAYLEKGRKDKSGKPLEDENRIFESMAKERAAFMLWLGDNWYTRANEHMTEQGLYARPTRDRSLKILQPLWKAMPHYAIWDDHDYGPNDGNKDYKLKETSRAVFMKNWANPSFGENGEGVYTKMTYSDVDFFLMDSRWFRVSDTLKDSLNGKPNAEKLMFGKQQMAWFKKAMRTSKANPNIHFRIIATGSQVLNTLYRGDAFHHYPAEYQEMMDFLVNEKINGVLFLTGDRHLSEINKRERPGAYTLYDVTSSPLTADPVGYAPNEKVNPSRIVSIPSKYNYSRLSFSGKGLDRKLLVEFLGTTGDKLAEWSTSYRDLRF